MPKPVQQPLPFFVGGGAPKILALAAREAQIVGINANLRSGDGTSPDAAESLTPAETDKKIQWVRDAVGACFDDIELQTLVGFVYIERQRVGRSRRHRERIRDHRPTKRGSRRRAWSGARTRSSSRSKSGVSGGRSRTT